MTVVGLAVSVHRSLGNAAGAPAWRELMRSDWRSADTSLVRRRRLVDHQLLHLLDPPRIGNGNPRSEPTAPQRAAERLPHGDLAVHMVRHLVADHTGDRGVITRQLVRQAAEDAQQAGFRGEGSHEGRWRGPPGRRCEIGDLRQARKVFFDFSLIGRQFDRFWHLINAFDKGTE